MTTQKETNFYDPRVSKEDDAVAYLCYILIGGVASLSVGGTLMNAYFELKDTAKKPSKKNPLLGDDDNGNNRDS